MADWTPEQLHKLATYGACLECGAPRETRIIVDGELVEPGLDERTTVHVGEVVESQLVCENGHRQG